MDAPRTPQPDPPEDQHAARPGDRERGLTPEQRYAAEIRFDAGGDGDEDPESDADGGRVHHEFLRGTPRRHHGHTRSDYELRGGERRGIRG